MSKCSCYREAYTSTSTRAICFGTREIDECSCGGDRLKCDFYPEVREKARSESEHMFWNDATRKLYNDLDLECWGEPRKTKKPVDLIHAAGGYYCKECGYWGKNNAKSCSLSGIKTDEYDFCSRGKLKV